MAALVAIAGIDLDCRAQLPCRYEIAAVIQAPNGGSGLASPTWASAISPNGRYVVGWFKLGAVGQDRGYWFDMQTGQLHILPFPGSDYQSSRCNDVNDAGLIVGSLWCTIFPAVQRGYVFDLNTGQFVTQLMPQPGAAYAEATGINAAGQVSGWRSIGSKNDPVWPQTAFEWSSQGGMNDLGVMNGPCSHAIGIGEDGTVFGFTGSCNITSSARGFVWRHGQLTILPAVPGALNSVVCAVLDEDHLVLSAIEVVNGVQRARGFALYRTAFTSLGVLPGWDNTFVWNVDQRGQVIGGCGNASNGLTFAFIWRDGRLIPIESLVVSGTALLGEAQDVSTSGIIVGTGVNAHGDGVGIILAPAPNRVGDTNCDLVVNVADMLNVINRWGACDACSSDVDGDRDVDVFDLIQVVLNWN